MSVKLNFGTQTNSNMQNSLEIFFFLFSTGSTIFFGKFGPENQICHFKLKFGTKTNSNMHISMVVLTFYVFYRKYPFWANLVQKIKIVSLSWNLVFRLIRIWKFQYFFLFSRGSTFFGGEFGKKNQHCWSWILEPRLI